MRQRNANADFEAQSGPKRASTHQNHDFLGLQIFAVSCPTLVGLELFPVITYGPLALHVPRYITYQCFDKGILDADA